MLWSEDRNLTIFLDTLVLRDMALVIDVADSSLQRDRVHKGRIYAAGGVPVYWIVNLIDRQVEVYTDPSGPDAAPFVPQSARL